MVLIPYERYMKVQQANTLPQPVQGKGEKGSTPSPPPPSPTSLPQPSTPQPSIESPIESVLDPVDSTNHRPPIIDAVDTRINVISPPPSTDHTHMHRGSRGKPEALPPPGLPGIKKNGKKRNLKGRWIELWQDGI